MIGVCVCVGVCWMYVCMPTTTYTHTHLAVLLPHHTHPPGSHRTYANPTCMQNWGGNGGGVGWGGVCACTYGWRRFGQCRLAQCCHTLHTHPIRTSSGQPLLFECMEQTNLTWLFSVRELHTLLLPCMFLFALHAYLPLFRPIKLDQMAPAVCCPYAHVSRYHFY